MNKSELSSKSYIQWRKTPWDTRNFGVLSAEFNKIICEDSNQLNELGNKFIEDLAKEGIELTYGRISSADRNYISAMQDVGFQYVETSYLLDLPNLQVWEAPKKLGNKTVSLLKATKDDIADIKKISSDNFFFGRFLEDPKINQKLAQKRQENWIDDLFSQGKEIMVSRSANGVLNAFMAYETKDGITNLILGGSRRDMGFFSYLFWISLLNKLREEGVKGIEVVVSTANINVVNLYSFLGFQFKDSLVGLRLFSNKNKSN